MSDTADAKCEKSEFGLKGRKKDKREKYIVKRPRPPAPAPAPDISRDTTRHLLLHGFACKEFLFRLASSQPYLDTFQKT